MEEQMASAQLLTTTMILLDDESSPSSSSKTDKCGDLGMIMIGALVLLGVSVMLAQFMDWVSDKIRNN